MMVEHANAVTSEYLVEASEQAVLSTLICDSDSFFRVPFLKDYHFYSSNHQTIFRAIASLHQKSIKPDVVSLLEEIQTNKGKVDLKFITSMSDAYTSSSNLEVYARKVVDNSNLRQLECVSKSIPSIIADAEISVEEKISRIQSQVTNIVVGGSVNHQSTPIKDLLNRTLDNIDKRSNGAVSGLKVGLSDLDEFLAGLKNGDLVIVAGRPSMGKSVLGLQIAAHNALVGNPSAFVSLEMSDIQLGDRVLASVGHIDLGLITKGQLGDEEYERVSAAVAKLHDKSLDVWDRGGATLPELCNYARKMKVQKGLKLLVVDYLQLMTGSGNNRNEIIGEISRGLKLLAKELDIPVIALSQINRGVESRQDRRPVMADLRESGAIEQDADVIMFVYRDEVYNPDSQDKGMAEILIAKNRQGKTGVVRLTFVGEQSRFGDFAWQQSDEFKQPTTSHGRSRPGLAVVGGKQGRKQFDDFTD